MVANKYAFLQLTRRRFLNEWEAFFFIVCSGDLRDLHSFPTRRSSDLRGRRGDDGRGRAAAPDDGGRADGPAAAGGGRAARWASAQRPRRRRRRQSGDRALPRWLG